MGESIMKKKAHVSIVLVLFTILCITLMHPITARAVPYNYDSVTKTQKIVVKEKGYLKVTSNRYVNHTLCRGRAGRMKNMQAAYDTKAYFAVTKGTYYLRSSSFFDFKVKYKFVEAKPDYATNTSLEHAVKLNQKKYRIALSFQSDKDVPDVRYYKIVPTKKKVAAFTTGTLLDKDGNEMMMLMRKTITPVYQSNGAATGGENTRIAKLSDIYTNPMYERFTADPLTPGETYYLRVDMKRRTYADNKGKKMKDTKTNAVYIAWE